MKKTIVAIVAIVLMGNLLSAQIFIDGKELRNESTQYIEIEFFGVVGSQDVRMFIDYGQNVGFLDRRNRIVSDDKGKSLIFNSSIHGLNWLSSQGFEVLHVYNPKSGGTSVNTDIVYLMKQKMVAEIK